MSMCLSSVVWTTGWRLLRVVMLCHSLTNGSGRRSPPLSCTARSCTKRGCLILPPQVLELKGSIPTRNYVQLPKTASKSLGLTGRFCYVQICPGKQKKW